LEKNEPSQNGMLSDSAYDLMEQLTKETQSLWRIRNYYKKDATDDKEAMEFWNYLEKDKTDHIKRLTELVEKRIKPR
jgi:hypothetical protein